MRLKIVIPRNKAEYEASTFPYSFIDDPADQIARKMSFEEYKWLFDMGVWDKIGELAESKWIQYDEEEVIEERKIIKRCKDWLAEFRENINPGEQKAKLLDDMINLFNEAIKRDSVVVIIL